MNALPAAALLALSSLALLAVPPAAATDCLAQSNPLGVGVVCDGPSSPSGADSTCAAETFGPLWIQNVGFACVAVSNGPGRVCVWASTNTAPTCS